MPLGLTKNYEDAAEAVKKYLTNIKVFSKTREIGEGEKQNVIEVIGDFNHFSITDMESFEWHLKFEFLDVDPKSDEERKVRGELAMNNPHLAGMFTNRTSMFVYRRVIKEVITKIDGKITSEVKTDDWIDFTKEFHDKLRREQAW